VTLTIVATVNATTPQTNTATVSHADQFDPNTANNTASVTTSAEQADLNLVKQVSPTAQMQGFDVTYTFILHNNGPLAATEVTVTDPFPAGLTIVGPNTPSQGTFDPATGIWTVGTLPNGATATLTVTARVEFIGPITNSARTAAFQIDPDLSNNTSTAPLTGLMPPDLISKRFFLSGGATTDVINLPALSVAIDPPATTTATATTPVPDVARSLTTAPTVKTAAPTVAPTTTTTTMVAPAAVTTTNSPVIIPFGAAGPGLLVGGGGTPDTSDGSDFPPKPMAGGPTGTWSAPGDVAALDRCLADWGLAAATGEAEPVSWWLNDLMSEPLATSTPPDAVWDEPVLGESALRAVAALT
jgi:uncharacterized repeat protein (TIGR01451 family)